MTRVTTKRLARILAKSNSGIEPNVTWLSPMKPVVCPTGLKIRQGQILVEYEGFRPKTMRVTQDHNSIMVR